MIRKKRPSPPTPPLSPPPAGQAWRLPPASTPSTSTCACPRTTTAFHAEHGHLAIPEHQPGGRFLVAQRALARENRLDPGRLARLAALDPHWISRTARTGTASTTSCDATSKPATARTPCTAAP